MPLVQIGHAQIGNMLSGQRADGDRHVLGALFDLLRGDDDFVAHAFGHGFVTLRRDGRLSERGGGQKRGGAEQDETDCGNGRRAHGETPYAACAKGR